MDEQWGSERFQACEHRSQAGKPLDGSERARGERKTHAAAGDDAVDVVGVRTVERDGAPHAEGVLEREHPVVVGVDQRKRLLARKRLDPQGAREAQQRAVETVEFDESGATGGLVACQIDDVGPLAREKQHRQSVFVANEWLLLSFCEGSYERLGPQVLVYVDLDHGC